MPYAVLEDAILPFLKISRVQKSPITNVLKEAGSIEQPVIKKGNLVIALFYNNMK